MQTTQTTQITQTTQTAHTSGARRLTSILMTGLLAGTLACGDSGSPDPGQAPTLPPAASMQSDLSLFQGGASIASGGQAVAVAGTNFLAASLTVGVATAATVIVMSVPTATFAAATSVSPVFEAGAFHWHYSTTVNAHTFVADLTGRPQGQLASWEMRVSSTASVPPLTEFLFITGTSRLDGSSGDWHIFDPGSPASRRELLAIDWTYESVTSSSVMFRNVTAGHPDIGDRLSYSTNGDVRNMQFLDASTNATTSVTWSLSTHAGSIQSPNFNGGVRACWSATLENVACP